MSVDLETLAYTRVDSSPSLFHTTPWQKYGHRSRVDASPREFQRDAGLDWKVDTLPTYIKTEKGEEIETGKKALVRTSDMKILDTVGPNWNPVQNEEAFDFFQEFVEANDMRMDTAGSLRGGRHVFISAKMHGTFELFGGDTITGHLLFSLPHQYGKSYEIRQANVREICLNTLSTALRFDTALSMKKSHRTVFDPEAIKVAMGLAREESNSFQEMAQFLGSRRFNEETLYQYIANQFGTNDEGLTKKGKKVMELVDEQPGAEFAQGSWWQAFNAVTHFYDHHAGHAKEHELRTYNSLFGDANVKKRKAAASAITFAERSSRTLVPA